MPLTSIYSCIALPLSHWRSKERPSIRQNIGRESNRFEEIEAGVIHSPDSVYTEHPDPRREEWQAKILPMLKKIQVTALLRFSGRSRSMVRRTLARSSRPRRRNQDLLKSVLQGIGVI
jgi:hypothetical protein